jgi:beta-lactamase superfamily II metal-dependent hydrolase
VVKIKSFSVGNGDMFYIDHSSDNFTLIDCNLGNLDIYRKMDVLDEIANISSSKGITRFISTHADQDHISGLKEIDERINILNFYTVNNEATKSDPTEDFEHYCTLRDNTKKAFYLHKDCSRRWMNRNDDSRGSAGLNVRWPILDNEYFKTELENAKKGLTPNNLSPIITYKLENGATVAWMGDLETEMMDNIVLEIELPKVNVLFAPHHGHTSGIVPDLWLDQMNPELIIIGEGPPEHLADYDGWNTITQNDTGHINLYLETGVVDIFVENPEYSASFLTNNFLDNDEDNEHYIGSIEIAS